VLAVNSLIALTTLVLVWRRPRQPGDVARHWPRELGEHGARRAPTRIVRQLVIESVPLSRWARSAASVAHRSDRDRGAWRLSPMDFRIQWGTVMVAVALALLARGCGTASGGRSRSSI
jgi:hypothetical protein